MATNTNPKEKAETPAVAPAAKKLLKNQKPVLIVEDERPLAHALTMKLKNDGYETVTCINGADALAEIQKNEYSIILLDLIMPVMDGFAFMEQLKIQKSTIPVIVLSNLGQDEDRVKAKELGAADYFVKSNTPIAEIVKRVKSLL